MLLRTGVFIQIISVSSYIALQLKFENVSCLKICFLDNLNFYSYLASLPQYFHSWQVLQIDYLPYISSWQRSNNAQRKKYSRKEH